MAHFPDQPVLALRTERLIGLLSLCLGLDRLIVWRGWGRGGRGLAGGVCCALPRTTKHIITRKAKPRVLQLLCISPPYILETLLRNVRVANWRRTAVECRHRAGLSPWFDTQIRARLGKPRKIQV